jgi:hypothetical protein
MVFSTESSDLNFNVINSNAINKLVWKRKYLWRASLGISHGHFDTELNTTFQQVQKMNPVQAGSATDVPWILVRCEMCR